MSEGFHYQESAGTKKSRKTQRWAFFIASMIVAAILYVTGRPEPPPGDLVTTTPPEALGRWVTTAPRYADRSMTVERNRVILELGPGVPDDVGIINQVRTWEEGAVQVVYLDYTTADGEQTLEMLLETPGRMRLRNPPDVLWTRSDP